MKMKTCSRKNLFLSGLFSLLTCSVISAQSLPYNNDYAFGLDVSFVKFHEDNGEKYYDTDSIQKPALQIFRDHGYNWARIMICNEPVNSRLPQDLEYVIQAAKDVKKYNYYFQLDMMFSNGWANPMIQPTPVLWVDMKHEERVMAVYDYVYKVISTLKNEGVLPDMVQIGNEIGNGFLWPDGRIYYDGVNKSEWEQLTDYLKSGAKAIRQVDSNNQVKIMLHEVGS